jgi:hypothetical protein
MAFSQWMNICKEAGFDAERMDPMTVFLLAGKIIHDPAVLKHNRAIHKMTEAERAELRERVSV